MSNTFVNELLLKFGSAPTSPQLTSQNIPIIKHSNKIQTLLSAASEGDIDGVRELLTKGKDPTVWQNKPLRDALNNGHLEVATLLLNDKRVNPGDCDNNAIVLACSKGQVKIVEFLLKDPRVDPNARNNEPLCNAVKNGQLQVVKLLLKDKRVDPNSNKGEALHIAIENGYYEIAEVLIATGKVQYFSRASL